MLTQPRDYRSIPLFADVSDSEWNDWKWQLRHRITTIEQARQVVGLADEEESALHAGKRLFRFAITPHYATFIDPADLNCPMRKQAIPLGGEFDIDPYEMPDPLAEDSHSPAPFITHRYPDRVLFLMTHECALYCRYCTRRRVVGDQQSPTNQDLDEAFAYLERHTEIRDVLISGGDPLAATDSRLEMIIARLRSISHIEIVRIGTRMPVVMPQRVTPELMAMLRKYHPIWINTHFNHPFELSSPATRAAMERIADAGIPSGNQTVLLRGVNDCPVVMRQLVHALLKVRCRPYYLYACDLSEGLGHFRAKVETGVAIIEALRGHTTGFAVPTFVIDAPGGGGKIPISPNYVEKEHDSTYTLRNFEGQRFEYHEGKDTPLSQTTHCSLCQTDHRAIDRGPAARRWQLGPKTDSSHRHDLVGSEETSCAVGNAISLTRESGENKGLSIS
ncbi:MAG TPA: KamA family radical SAM protein [Candidatus Dormibacteraeota bacterium]|nr:KamA family radical SAM protein [Candidatus Dormibacteraeota bacterium]